MAKHPETPITDSIIAYIKEQGGDAFHVHGSTLQRGGEPDICGEVKQLGVWRHLKIEVKTDTGEPNQRQLYRLNQYHKRGYWVGVVTSIGDLNVLLECYKEVEAGSLQPLFYRNLPYAKDIYA